MKIFLMYGISIEVNMSATFKSIFSVGLFHMVLLLPVMANAEPPRDRLAYILDVSEKIKFSERTLGDNSIFKSFKVIDRSSANFGIELCVLEVPFNEVYLKVKEVGEQSHIEGVYKEYVPDHAIGAITGGFFGYDLKGSSIPLGFVKVNGKVINKMHPWTSGGVITSNEREINILRTKNFIDRNSIMHALQSKPLLIEEGIDGIRTNNFDRFDRSAIAITSDNRIFFAVIHEPGGRAASLAEFSSILLKLKSKNDGYITWALAMDGGPGAHLYIPEINRHCGAMSPNFIPNLIYIEK